MIDQRLDEFFWPDAVLETLPNRFLPRGRQDDLAGARAAAERGKNIMSLQRYEITKAVAGGDLVAMEVDWTGTLAIPFETIPAGGQMRARVALFLQFRDGKMVGQHNYDCYEPW
jgi:ketosteroid isomerase-like protein